MPLSGSKTRRSPRAAIACALALAASMAFATSTARAAVDPAATAAIRDAVARIKAGAAVQVGSESFAARDELPLLYERRSYEPLWVTAASVRELMAAVTSTYDEGLAPDDYHYATLRSLVGDSGDVMPADPATRAAADLVLTDALIRLGLDLRFGKVDPAKVDAAWSFLKTENDDVDADAAAWAALAVERGEIGGLVERSRPAIEGYESLQRELVRLREIESTGGWASVPGTTTLRPGDRDPRVLALRARLEASGELAGGEGLEPAL